MATIKELLEPIIGTYEPQEIEVTVTKSDVVVMDDGTGLESYEVVANPETIIEYVPDYTFIASAVIFLIFIYSIFRMLGGLLKWKI